MDRTAVAPARTPRLQGAAALTDTASLRGGSTGPGLQACAVARGPLAAGSLLCLAQGLGCVGCVGCGPGGPVSPGRPGLPGAPVPGHGEVRGEEREQTRVKWALLPGNFLLRSASAFPVRLRPRSACETAVPDTPAPSGPRCPRVPQPRLRGASRETTLPCAVPASNTPGRGGGRGRFRGFYDAGLPVRVAESRGPGLGVPLCLRCVRT